jgi:hypothetical protein
MKMVVINTEPLVSPPLDREVQALIERRFPSAQRIGRFVVRW